MHSLDKLRDGEFEFSDPDKVDYEKTSEEAANELADEIQAEIDYYYLPRPLFEDGEPVQFGDEYDCMGATFEVHGVQRFSDGSYLISGQRENGKMRFPNHTRVKRPRRKNDDEAIANEIIARANELKDYLLERCGGSVDRANTILDKMLKDVEVVDE